MTAVDLMSGHLSDGMGREEANEGHLSLAAGLTASSLRRTQLSRDGSWWWNGRHWVSAVTEDGLWHWDGQRWTATVHLDGKSPEDLAATLSLLAEDHYVKAGAILTDRASDWQPEAGLRDLVEHANDVRGRLDRVEGALGLGEGHRRARLSPRDRRQLEAERDVLRDEYTAVAARLAHSAPQPSIKEADDMLAAAQLLGERAALVRSALADVEDVERMRAEAAVAAQKELAGAEEARLKALQSARKAVDYAEAAHSFAVAQAQARLGAALRHSPGELKAGVGPLRLMSTWLESPTGRLPAAHLQAYAGTARALWAEHREKLEDMVLLEASETEAFLTGLTNGNGAVFVLMVGTTGMALWPCPPGHERAAERFAAVVIEHGVEAAAAMQRRAAELHRAEDELDSVIRDRSSIEAAERELSRVGSDPELLNPINAARGRLERTRTDTPELLDARRKLLELGRRLVQPPEPLRVSTAC